MKRSMTCPRCERRVPEPERARWGGLCQECYRIRARELEVHGGVYTERVAVLRLLDLIRRWEDRLRLMDERGVNVVHTPEGFEFSRKLTEKLLANARVDLMAIQSELTDGKAAA